MEPPMRPQDILPDDHDHVRRGALTIRKGSVGAFLANARMLADPQASPAARSAAEADLQALVPALQALGLFEVFTVRDPKVAALVAAALA